MGFAVNGEKGFFWGLVFLFVFLILLVIINQMDSQPTAVPFKLANESVAFQDHRNGFYLIWALVEPVDVVVPSTAVFNKYSDQDFDYQDYQVLFRQLTRRAQTSGFSWKSLDDMDHVLDNQSSGLEAFRDRLAVVIQRYQRLLDTEMVADFTSLGKDVRIPDFRALVHVSKLNTILVVRAAFNGAWNVSVDNCFKQMELAKKITSSARTLDANLAGKKIMQLSLRSLTTIINHPKCPPEIRGMAPHKLPLLSYTDSGSRNALIGEYLMFESRFDSFKGHFRSGKKDLPQPMLLFFQEQRTKGYFRQFIETIMRYDETPPWRWQDTIPPKPVVKQSPLWWLVNMSGKLLYDIIQMPEFSIHISETHTTMVLYELTRIALLWAAAGYGTGVPAPDIAKLVRNTGRDPFSGVPYRWLVSDNIRVYSVGTNRRDDGGRDDRFYPDGDIVVFCRQ